MAGRSGTRFAADIGPEIDSALRWTESVESEPHTGNVCIVGFILLRASSSSPANTNLDKKVCVNEIEAPAKYQNTF